LSSADTAEAPSLAGEAVAPGTRSQIVVAATAVLVPLLFGGVAGVMLGDGSASADRVRLAPLLEHNLSIGLAVVLAGWATLGVGALALSAVGACVNGYSLGVYLSDAGVAATLERLPHFVPEVGGLIALTVAGMCTGAIALDVALGRMPGTTARERASTALIFVCAGCFLLVAAAPLEHLVPAA
jgi:hypothetical protein